MLFNRAFNKTISTLLITLILVNTSANISLAEEEAPASGTMGAAAGGFGATLTSFCEQINKIAPLMNSFQMGFWPVMGFPGVASGLSLRTNVIVDYCNLWNQVKGNSILEGSYLLAEKANEEFDLKMNKQIAFARRTTSFAQSTFDLDENMRKRKDGADKKSLTQYLEESNNYATDVVQFFDIKPKTVGHGASYTLQKHSQLSAKRAVIAETMNCPVEDEVTKMRVWTDEELNKARARIEKYTAESQLYDEIADSFYDKIASILGLMMTNLSSQSRSISERAGAAAKRKAENAKNFAKGMIPGGDRNGQSGYDNFGGTLNDALNDLNAMNNNSIKLEMSTVEKQMKAWVMSDVSKKKLSPQEEAKLANNQNPEKSQGQTKTVTRYMQVFTTTEVPENRQRLLGKWEAMWRDIAARNWDVDDDKTKLDGATTGWQSSMKTLVMNCDEQTMKAAMKIKALPMVDLNSSEPSSITASLEDAVNEQRAEEGVRNCVTQAESQQVRKEDTLDFLRTYTELWFDNKLKAKRAQGLAMTDRSAYLGVVVKIQDNESVIPRSTADKTKKGTQLLDEATLSNPVCQTKLSPAQMEKMKSELDLVGIQIQEEQLKLLKQGQDRYFLEKEQEKAIKEKQQIFAEAEAQKNKQSVNALSSIGESVGDIPIASGTPASTKITKEAKEIANYVRNGKVKKNVKKVRKVKSPSASSSTGRT